MLNADGSYTYNPNGVFDYLDTASRPPTRSPIKSTDGTALSNDATVTITITGVNDPPTAANVVRLGRPPRSSRVDATLNATDVDGEALTFSIVASPTTAPSARSAA